MHSPSDASYHIKMAVSTSTSIDAMNITGLTKRIDYKTMIPYLPDHLGMDIRLFDVDLLKDQFYLDTAYCVIKRKTFNTKCLYDTFTEYTDLDCDQVKSMLINELTFNSEWYKEAGVASLGMRGIQYQEFLNKLKKKRTWPNELAL